jgi:hypothetical protein
MKPSEILNNLNFDSGSSDDEDFVIDEDEEANDEEGLTNMPLKTVTILLHCSAKE